MKNDPTQHTPVSAPVEAAGGRSVFIKTFGCQMNEYDSEKMYSLLSGDYSPVASYEDAELVIVNTCSVRNKAEHKLFSLLGRLSQLKEKKRSLVIGVSGCVAQQEGERIIQRNRDVDFVVGTHNLSLVPSLVERVRDGYQKQVAIDYRDEWEELPNEFTAFSSPSSSGKVPNMVDFGVGMNRVRALVAIQRGCSKMCTYCVVPGTRGPEVSRNPDEILREIRLKVNLGAREVLLLGQTVNSYGKDLSPRIRFSELVQRIAEVEGIKRIRFTSPHPAEVKTDFLDLYGSVPSLCPHIHLPLQSGSNRILKLMNRNYHRDRYLSIVEEVKTRVPEIAVGTDVIVGFPTETAEDFSDTLDIMERVRFNQAFSFKYSKRPNTKALECFTKSDEIPSDVAGERLFRLQELQKQHSLELNSSLIGTTLEVLVEEGSDGTAPLRGRSPGNVLVEIEPSKVKGGSLVSVEVTSASAQVLRGRIESTTESRSEVNA